jgi:hypothetical protein
MLSYESHSAAGSILLKGARLRFDLQLAVWKVQIGKAEIQWGG